MNQAIIESMLSTIAGITGKVEGAFNLRQDGKGVQRYSTENVKIIPKEDRPGIDILVRPGTKGESVHIPVILTETGLNDLESVPGRRYRCHRLSRRRVCRHKAGNV